MSLPAAVEAKAYDRRAGGSGVYFTPPVRSHAVRARLISACWLVIAALRLYRTRTGSCMEQPDY